MSSPQCLHVGDENTTAGEFRLDLLRPNAKGDDADMIHVFSMYSDAVVFGVPVIAPGFSQGGLPAAPAQGTKVTRFYSDDGRYCFNVQGDLGGHIVQYDRHGTDDESQWTAVAQFKAAEVV